MQKAGQSFSYLQVLAISNILTKNVKYKYPETSRTPHGNTSSINLEK